MIGKGSVSHNSRTFIAENVDAVRTKNNIVFCSHNIKHVYHDLFDAALQQYNNKQTRGDRRIPDYYEKIRTGKQEKLFHEVIFQVGNKDDMNAKDENGDLAKSILSDFMGYFQQRNPFLKVFSAHLHMDEETPHLHIDFVPFTTGSKRGLETRVSLKQALAKQGFTGGSRSETEWNKWVQAEKEELSKVMERHDVQWENLDTHKPHLSVLDYKKKERVKEVATLEKEVNKIETKLNELHESEDFVILNVDRYYKNKAWQVPSPAPFMSAKNYMDKVVHPFVMKLKDVIKSIISMYLRLRNEHKKLSGNVVNLKKEVKTMNNLFKRAMRERAEFESVAEDFDKVKNAIGTDKVEDILSSTKSKRIDVKDIAKKMNYER